jgi:hypothetical protein
MTFLSENNNCEAIVCGKGAFCESSVHLEENRVKTIEFSLVNLVCIPEWMEGREIKTIEITLPILSIG